MKIKLKFYGLLFAILFILNNFGFVFANPEEIYHFANPKQSQQFQSLLSQLRCLVCQNQDLKDSQAPLAEDLRQEVYQQVSRGFSTPKIKAYLTQRYGNFILFNPPFVPQTYALWLGPWLILILSLGALAYIIFRHQRLKEL